MRWDVRVAEKARRAHRRAPKGDQTRIAAALEAMREDPLAGDVVHLKNESAARQRKERAPRTLPVKSLGGGG